MLATKPRVFLVSDTHFGHKNILKYEADKRRRPDRPFNDIAEHDNWLVARWNETVGAADTVWHLGDVCFGRSNLGIVRRLNGAKHLVMGNHDHYPVHEYTQAGFLSVRGAAELHGFLLTHIPVHPDSLQPRYLGNIHGHLHSAQVADVSEAGMRYFNAAVENHELRPVLFDDLVRRLGA